MTGRVRLGSWDLPSGQNVEAYYTPTAEGEGRIDMAWDDPPPLLPDDERFYRVVIRPAVIAAVRQYTEKVGGATLVLEL